MGGFTRRRASYGVISNSLHFLCKANCWSGFAILAGESNAIKKSIVRRRRLDFIYSTTCFTGCDLLARKFESPLYSALIDSVPTLSVEVLKLAEPPCNDPVPNTVLPFINEIVSPSGGAPALEATVAVKVTACPYVDGFGEAVMIVVVFERTSISATKASYSP
jgi:hypothetical protein